MRSPFRIYWSDIRDDLGQRFCVSCWVMRQRFTGSTRNDFEEAFVAVVDVHRLPRPRFNADVVVRGRHFNVDCLWRERRLIVELDGREVHGTERAFETDRERDRLLLADGWRVMRLTWRQVRDVSAEIVADLRVLLEDAPVAGGV
jgi:very-short-patch-repair endonuclease